MSAHRAVNSSQVVNIEDLRHLAQRRVPRSVFDYLDGGAEAELTLEGLTAAVGFIRREVAERLHLRRSPELYFQLDRSQTYAARIDELLKRNKKRSR